MNDAPEHATNRLATLIEHLREYGSILDVLGDALEKGEATRFRQDVLNPVTEAATQGNPRLVIPALVAGLSFTYSRLTIRQHPTTAEREKLRDRLIQFEQELQDLPPPKTRWLSGNVDPHLVVTSEVRKLIADCRAAFTRLAVPLPSGMSKRLERLQTLEASIRSVLETAPTDWPPAAPLRVESLAQWASEPFAQSLAQLQDALFEALLGRGDVAQTALTAADRLIGLACPDPVRLAWLDRALVLLRGWGSGVGVRFLPENWSFSDPPAVGTLDPDEVESIPVYRQDIPQGMPVRVKVLGVVHEGQILRPAVVPVSAGPVPA
ncbi:MAG: hypothetical protein LC104_11855, partial [Bacteroidales bacterium]|nr:hypothetical protein [Bacteroidales bacterium]